MANTCVGLGFVVSTDGTLGLNGPRSGAFPYSGAGCTPSAINGLRLDAATGNLWVEPPDVQVRFSGSQLQSPTPYTVPTTITAVSPAVSPLNVTSTDTCRSSVACGSILVTVSFTTGTTSDVINVYGGAYTGTPPGTGPARATLVAGGAPVGTALTASFLAPFSAVILPGATATLTSLVQVSQTAGSTAKLTSWSVEYQGTVLTQRTAI